MPQLTIEGFDVRVAPGLSYEVSQHGDFERAFSGRMRSDIRGHHRVFRVATPELTTSEMTDLRVILHGPQPVEASGDMVGVVAAFLVRDIRIQPITATDWVVTFALHEVDSS